MGYHTWHTYGYGVKTTDISVASKERIEKLLSNAPKYQNLIQGYFDKWGVKEPTIEDYTEFEEDGHGLASFLGRIINEAEGIELEACDDFDMKDYLLYTPTYPWWMKEQDKDMTQEKIAQIFVKYLTMITDDDIVLDYYEVANGG